MTDLVAYTAPEVAFVLREPVRSVRKAFDDGPVEPKLVRKPGGMVRAVEWADLLYLFVVRTLRDELTPKARIEFYHALKQAPVDHAREIRFGRLSVAIDDLRTEVSDRTHQLADLAGSVEFREDGEAVLKGSNVEVYRIAALLSGGVRPEDILEDYPSLDAAAIATAKAYAEAYPKVGRPYPAGTVKRALRGAGLEALDDVLHDRA